MYTAASDAAIINGKHNLSLAKTLYRMMKEKEKGSSEARRIHEEIVKVALRTENLDYRKSINDIADKAQSYTKGEFTNEENTN
jgi:hypothetical protein